MMCCQPGRCDQAANSGFQPAGKAKERLAVPSEKYNMRKIECMQGFDLITLQRQELKKNRER